MPCPDDGLASADRAIGTEVLYRGVPAEDIVIRLERQADLLLLVGEEKRDIERGVGVDSV